MGNHKICLRAVLANVAADMSCRDISRTSGASSPPQAPSVFIYTALFTSPLSLCEDSPTLWVSLGPSLPAKHTHPNPHIPCILLAPCWPSPWSGNAFHLQPLSLEGTPSPVPPISLEDAQTDAGHTSSREMGEPSLSGEGHATWQ